MAYLLQRLLTEAVVRQPQRPAVASDGCLLTYQELDRLSNKMARALLRLGVAPGDRVAILAPKSTAAADLGARIPTRSPGATPRRSSARATLVLSRSSSW